MAAFARQFAVLLLHFLSLSTFVWPVEASSPPGTASFKFHSNAELKSAVREWIANKKSAAGKYGLISEWNVSLVTDMENMFRERKSFNADISTWDVSHVTNMKHMFFYASAFNADISRWDVSRVTYMGYMIYAASAFNADISSWNVSRVTNMHKMFFMSGINADLSNWDVNQVTTMKEMFHATKVSHCNKGRIGNSWRTCEAFMKEKSHINWARIDITACPTAAPSTSQTSRETTSTQTTAMPTSSISSPTTVTTSTTSTSTALPGSPEALEAAQAAASRAVAEVEEAMSEQARAAIGNVNLSVLSKGVLVSSPTISGKQVTIAIVSAEGANQSGGLSFSAGQVENVTFQPQIQVPVSTLQSVSLGGLVAIAASVMDETATAALMSVATQRATSAASEGKDRKDLSPPPKLESLPLVLTLYDEEGKPLPVRYLNEPIVLTLAPTAYDNMSCVFWNESLGDWDDSGLERFIDENSTEFKCKTYHLSIFGAVSGFISRLGQEVVNVLECSNAGSIFSAEAAANIFRGQLVGASYKWREGGPAVFVWVVLAVQCACLAWAASVDSREAQLLKKGRDEQGQGVQEETRGQQSDQASAGKKTTRSVGETLIHARTHILRSVRNSVDLPRVPLKLVNEAVSKVQCFHLQVDNESIQPMVKLQRSKPTSIHHLVSKTEAVANGRLLGEESDFWMDRMLEASFCQKVSWLLFASHPLMLSLSFSLHISRTARTFLVIVKILSAAACIALFYQSTGALAANAPPKCFTEEKDLAGETIKSIITGAICSLLSDGMLLFLVAVRGEQCPELAVLEADDPAEAAQKLDRARRKAFVKLLIFWVVAIPYALLASYIMVCFLANVAHDDAVGFMNASIISVLQFFIIKPAGMALLLAIACSLVYCWSPDMIRKVKEEKKLRAGRQDGQSAQDGVGSRRQIQVFDLMVEDVETAAQLPRASGSEQLPSIEALGREKVRASKSTSERLAKLEDQTFEDSILPGQPSESQGQP